MLTEYGIRNLKRYCREPIENIKGYREAVEAEDGGYVCHHLNELTFTKNELKKMKMIYHRPASELVIMTRSEHKTWHNKWNGHPMKGRTGDKAPMYGKGYLITGDKAPMYGRTGDKHVAWKGDKACPITMYSRALKLYKSGQISEEELQQFRDKLQDYRRLRRNQTI